MRTVIGVMGGAVAEESVAADAYSIGRMVALHDFVLVNGGRDRGVMAASAAGAAEAGGLVIGILPGEDATRVAGGIDVAVITGMGDARNSINVLTSNVVVAFPGGAGTLSEVALALKSCRPVVTVGFDVGPAFDRYRESGLLHDAITAEQAFAKVLELVGSGPR